MGKTHYPGSPAHGGDGGKWRPIATAPRHGTIIEIRCTYGVALWYGLFRWILNSPTSEPQNGRWAKVGDEDAGFCEDESFTWRPYDGSVEAYVDPTGGAQDRPDYWQAAIAAENAKYGLPTRSDTRQPSWLDRLAAWFRGR